jgi:hypothetical protein
MGMSVKSQKRSIERKIFNKTIHFELSIMESGQLKNIQYDGLALDISQAGLGLSTEYALKEGDVLKLIFPINELNITLPVFAETVWSKPANGHFRAGLRFLV